MWLKTNGESIYATRPWTVFGEGPDVRMGDRDDRSPYSAANIRYTQSKDGRTLYAIQMGWPGDGKELEHSSFGPGGPGANLRVSEVSLLGSNEKIAWSREESGLIISAPAAAPSDLAVVYKIALDDGRESARDSR